MKPIVMGLVLLVCSINFCQAQTNGAQNTTATSKTNEPMKTYVIERVIPGAGAMTQDQLKGISQRSCKVLDEMGPRIEWQHSYVTGDKVYCVYKANNKEAIMEHAKKGNFPANSISEVATVIDPSTAEQ